MGNNNYKKGDNHTPALSLTRRGSICRQGTSHTNAGEVKKNAFSLAEVLITLAILGVVALLTVPHIQHSYKERITVTKVKKFYAALDRAYDRYKIDNRGSLNRYYGRRVIDGKDVSGYSGRYGDSQIVKFLKEYLDISVDIGYNCDDIKNYMTDEDWLCDGQAYTIKLKDGSFIQTSDDGTNGYYKQVLYYYPQKAKEYKSKPGQNYFTFSIGDNVIYPSFIIDDNGLDNQISRAETECMNGNREYCAAYIIKNGNMNYLKKKKKKKS